MEPSASLQPPADGTPKPSPPVTDLDRERAALQLQQACGEGRLTLEEYTDRVGAVWAAETADALVAATGGIALPRPGATTRDTKTMINFIGDRTRAGRWRLPHRLRLIGILGDWKLDLRNALVTADAAQDGLIDLIYVSLLGDMRFTVPDGVDVEYSGFHLVGDEKIDLAPVPPRAGTPRVRIRGFGLLGDIVIRSAPR